MDLSIKPSNPSCDCLVQNLVVYHSSEIYCVFILELQNCHSRTKELRNVISQPEIISPKIDKIWEKLEKIEEINGIQQKKTPYVEKNPKDQIIRKYIVYLSCKYKKIFAIFYA